MTVISFSSSYEDAIRGSGMIEYPQVLGQYVKTAEEAEQALKQALEAVKWFKGDE